MKSMTNSKHDVNKELKGQLQATNQLPGRPGMVEAGVDEEGRVDEEESGKDTLHRQEMRIEREHQIELNGTIPHRKASKP